MIKMFIESESFQDETEIFLVNDLQQKLEIEVKFEPVNRKSMDELKLKRKFASEEYLPIMLNYLGVVTSSSAKLSWDQKHIYLKIFLSNRAMQNMFHEVFYQFATKLGLSTQPIKLEDEKEAMTEIKDVLQACQQKHPLGLNAASAQTAILARWYLSKQKKHVAKKKQQGSHSFHYFLPIQGQSDTLIIQAYSYKKYIFEKEREFGRVKRCNFEEIRQKQKKQYLISEHLQGLNNAFSLIECQDEDEDEDFDFDKYHVKMVIIRSIAIIHDEERGQVELYSDKDRVLPASIWFDNCDDLCDQFESVSQIDQCIQKILQQEQE